MLKVIVAVSAMAAAVPATAQQVKDAAPAAGAVPSVATPGAPKATPPAQAAEAAQGLPASQRPAARADAVATAAAPVKTDDGRPQTPAPQVAAIVGREFPAYDRNRSGALEPEEFGAWMAALKAREPDAAPGDKPDPQWSLAAFAKADADGSKSVSKVELASFFNGTRPVSS